MKFSYRWIIKYNAYHKMPEGVPSPEEVARMLENGGHVIEKMTYVTAEESGMSEDDVIYDISVHRNRPDFMNMSWFAKEMCGYYHRFFRDFATYWTDGSKKEMSGREPEKTELKVSTTSRKCRLVTGTILKYVNFKTETPQEYKDRLIATGFVPENGLKDSLHYIMRASGQPVYLFNLAKLKSKKIVVKDSEQEDSIVYKGKCYPVHKGDCIITCEDDILGVCGVLLNDEFTADIDTTSVLILSALFDRNAVRDMMLKYDVHNYMSLLSSIGSCPQDIVRMPGGAARQIFEIAEADGFEMTAVFNKCDMTRTFLTYTVEEINQLLDTDFTYEEIKETFENPEMPTNEIGDGRVNTMMPSYRQDKTVNDLAHSLLVYWGCDRIGRRAYESQL